MILRNFFNPSKRTQRLHRTNLAILQLYFVLLDGYQFLFSPIYLMTLTEIVQSIGKYHYFYSNQSRTTLLSSSSSKTEARKEALTKLKPNIDKLIDKQLYLLTLKKIPKKDLEEQKKTILKVYGGPLVAIIDTVVIKSANKLKNIGSGENNKVYFKQKFLDENTLSTIDIKKIVTMFHSKKLKQGLFHINIYSNKS
jgi:hypothetical protein